jgi:hypothetical protein
MSTGSAAFFGGLIGSVIGILSLGALFAGKKDSEIKAEPEEIKETQAFND